MRPLPYVPGSQQTCSIQNHFSPKGKFLATGFSGHYHITVRSSVRSVVVSAKLHPLTRSVAIATICLMHTYITLSHTHVVHTITSCTHTPSHSPHTHMLRSITPHTTHLHSPHSPHSPHCHQTP